MSVVKYSKRCSFYIAVLLISLFAHICSARPLNDISEFGTISSLSSLNAKGNTGMFTANEDISMDRQRRSNKKHKKRGPQKSYLITSKKDGGKTIYKLEGVKVPDDAQKGLENGRRKYND